MLRRNTEGKHDYSRNLFKSNEIYDLQGLLKEGDVYQCGIESYSVEREESIDFSFLMNSKEDLARFRFCTLLGIPYYNIVTVSQTYFFYLYEIKLVDSSRGELKEFFYKKMEKDEFLKWWSTKQSFTQIKPMYDAKDRLKDSLVDKVLFDSKLAWGINIDGFALDEEEGIKYLVEKRIRTYKNTSYSVENYDPNRYFHGVGSRAGDFESWNILFQISQKLGCPLLLMTFDTNDDVNKMGIAKVVEVCKSKGLTYEREIKIFEGKIDEYKEYIERQAKRAQ